MKDNSPGPLVGIGLVCVICLVIWQTNKEEFLATNWTKVGLIFGGVLLFLSLLIFLVYSVYKKRKYKPTASTSNESWAESRRKRLNQTLTIDFDKLSSVGIRNRLDEIKGKLDYRYCRMYKDDKPIIENFYQKAEKIIKEREAEEEEIKQHNERIAEEKEEEEQKKREIQKKQETKLFNFKKSKNSLKALPLNKKYSEEVIRGAERQMEIYLEKKRREREVEKEALRYYQDNPLDTQPDISEWEKPFYAKARKKKREEKINPKAENIEDPLPKNFYKVKEMDEDLKKKAKAQGFKYTNKVNLDGKLCGGFFIKPTSESESDYHFVIKHQFGELHPKMKVEHTIDNKRADAAYITDKLKIAIEIEQGTNNQKQITAKMEWLKRNFNYVIFVYSRGLITKYSQYVDNQQSFCLPLKEAKAKVLSLIG